MVFPAARLKPLPLVRVSVPPSILRSPLALKVPLFAPPPTLTVPVALIVVAPVPVEKVDLTGLFNLEAGALPNWAGMIALAEKDGQKPERSRGGPKPRAPRLDDIAASLADRLDTRVKVDLGRNKGKVTIEFASIDDLERIIKTIDPRLGETGEPLA